MSAMEKTTSVTDTVNTEAFRALTVNNQCKVLIIYSLALIYKEMKKGRLTTKAFDHLYDTETILLEQYLMYCEDALRVYRNIHNKIEWE